MASTQGVAGCPSSEAAIDGNSFTLGSSTGGDNGGGGVYEGGNGVTAVFSTIDGNSLTIGSDTGGDDGGGGVASQGGDIERRVLEHLGQHGQHHRQRG